ncbi:MAG: AAA family ATPase [Rhodospirillales bacterium]|nr:AAA family ATPase [Rhodospirillales bacterium]
MIRVINEDDIDPQFRDPEFKRQIMPASDFVQEAIDFWHGEKTTATAVMPWPKTHDKIQFRPGEVTLWPGINGHGKSLITSQIALHLRSLGMSSCIGSFEMQPAATFRRMARQGICAELPTPQVLHKFAGWLGDAMWLYTVQGMVDRARLMTVMRYCAGKLGVSHFFVDSLMKCVRGVDDYNGQKDFIDQCCAVARDTGLHIHIVAHSRKLASERDTPGKFDVAGAGAITDQVDNVITVWRNKSEKREEGTPDCLLCCDKQRHGSSWEGKIGLWFEPRSQSFIESERGRPWQYVNGWE